MEPEHERAGQPGDRVHCREIEDDARIGFVQENVVGGSICFASDTGGYHAGCMPRGRFADFQLRPVADVPEAGNFHQWAPDGIY